MAKTVFDVLDTKLADIQRSQEDFVTQGGQKTTLRTETRAE